MTGKIAGEQLHDLAMRIDKINESAVVDRVLAVPQ